MYALFLLISLFFFSLYPACTTNGAFIQVAGSPFATGGILSTNIAFSPLTSNNLFAAASNAQSSDISIYSVNLANGFFTPINLTFPTVPLPQDIAFSPIVSNNLFAGVVGNGQIAIYSVNQSIGVFTPVSGSPFPVTGFLSALAFSPIVTGGLFLATTNFTGNTVAVFFVDESTGSITPVLGSPFNTGTTPLDVAFSSVTSNGQLILAVPNEGSANVSVYRVDQTTGVLTQVSGSPFSVGVGSSPAAVAFSPITSSNMLFAAVVDNNNNVVDVFQVDQSTGVFTQVAGSPFNIGAGSEDVTFFAIGNNLFAATTNSSDNTVSVFSVNPTTGFFTQINGSPFATGVAPAGIAISPATPNLFAAVANAGSNNISVYEICALAPSPSIQPPQSLAIRSLKNIFLVQTDLINVITWQPPLSGTQPTSYRIYRDPALTQFVAQVDATSALIYCDHNRQCGTKYQYFIVSVDASGNVSVPATISITT